MSYTDKRDLLPLWDQLFSQLLDPETVKDEPELRSAIGIDIDAIVQDNTKLFLRLRASALAEVTASRFDGVRKFLDQLRAGILSSTQEYQDFANNLLSKPKFAELSPMFRNLSEVTEADKLDILLDAKILELLEEAQREFDKQSISDD